MRYFRGSLSLESQRTPATYTYIERAKKIHAPFFLPVTSNPSPENNESLDRYTSSLFTRENSLCSARERSSVVFRNNRPIKCRPKERISKA